jgi:hypothetical protein
MKILKENKKIFIKDKINCNEDNEKMGNRWGYVLF